MTLQNLIDALGGCTAVGKHCGVSPSAVTNWVMRGSIAAEHRLTVWRLAVAADLDWRPPGSEGVRLVPVAPGSGEAA